MNPIVIEINQVWKRRFEQFIFIDYDCFIFIDYDYQGGEEEESLVYQFDLKVNYLDGFKYSDL